jgi:hypothetical protein
MYKFFFSDWLYIWFILYKLNVTNFNPKFCILIGIIENIIIIGFLFKYVNKIKYYKKITIYFTIKLLILYILQDTNIRLNDIIFGMILYLIYNIYLKIFFNQTNIGYYKERLGELNNII